MLPTAGDFSTQEPSGASYSFRDENRELKGKQGTSSVGDMFEEQGPRSSVLSRENGLGKGPLGDDWQVRS